MIKLYTRVNSNEHFHAIKLKELLVDNEKQNKEKEKKKKRKKKETIRGEGCEWKKEKEERE